MHGWVGPMAGQLAVQLTGEPAAEPLAASPERENGPRRKAEKTTKETRKADLAVPSTTKIDRQMRSDKPA